MPIQAISGDIATAVDVELNIGDNASMVQVEVFLADKSIFKDNSMTVTGKSTTEQYKITDKTHFKCGVVVALSFEFVDTKAAAFVQLLGAGVAMTAP